MQNYIFVSIIYILLGSAIKSIPSGGRLTKCPNPLASRDAKESTKKFGNEDVYVLGL